MARCLPRLLLLLAALLLPSLPASAHLMPNSVINLDFATTRVSAEILLPINELEYGLGRTFPMAADGGLGASERPLRAYILRHIAVRAEDGRPWQVRLLDLRVMRDPYQADLRAELMLTPPEGASPRRFQLRYDAIIDRVANHFVLVFAHSDFGSGTLAGEPQMIGGLQQPTFELLVDRGEGSAWRGFASAVRLGMHHIAEGHDHLLFLIALLLPAPLLARGRRWSDYGGPRHTALGLARVITAFTVGHSLTLIGGAFFGWQLPARPVEVMIAVSILISAIHAFRPLFAGREAWVAGGFGLIHGLAFATIIANFGLEPLQKAQSILGFNLGIELVQLLVVACVMPSLLYFARTRAYPAIRTAGALLAGVAATAWIVERVSGTENIIAESIDAALGRAPWLVAALTVAAAVGWIGERAPGAVPRFRRARRASGRR